MLNIYKIVLGEMAIFCQQFA